MPDRHPPRIVLADDDADACALLARQLQSAGYDVIACKNGRDALEAIQQETSCIVVADWVMPEMDGLELCRTVRALAEMQALSLVYFILLTARSDRDQIVAGLEAGADDYLTKPYHKQELLARVRAGERIYDLQTELVQRQIELAKVNSEFARLNQKLEELASTDTLTGLANRRHLFDRFAEAWALSNRNDQPLGCVMIDIDKFKSINDTYGHAAGDAILRALTATCRACLRRYDVLGRIGGEEFCVACPDTPLEGVARLAERICSAVAQTEFQHDGIVIPVTVSLGVSSRGPEYNGVDDLVRAADAMLYRAKQNGRNQVWVCDRAGQATPLGEFTGKGEDRTHARASV
jgi:diguanylate cyclase (GGDEF)-like protein